MELKTKDETQRIRCNCGTEVDDEDNIVAGKKVCQICYFTKE